MPKTVKKPAPPAELPPLTEDTLKGLALRAEAEEPGAAKELRSRLAAKGTWQGVFRGVSVKAENVLTHQAGKQWAEDPAERRLQEELARSQIQRMKETLAGPNPSPVEWALASRAALCWYLTEECFAYDLAAGTLNARSVQEFHSKRQERYHRMFLSAVKVLAQVRRLQLPALTVNIADKQINVGGG